MNGPPTAPAAHHTSANGHALTAHDLGKRFADRDVLRDVCLTVARGEVCGLIGPSGGGKSTLLRCLNGLEHFERGRIEVAGVSLDSQCAPRQRSELLATIRRRVGMVFQSFQLFPHRTVLGNVIEAPVHVLRMPRQQAESEARVLLDRVGLSDKLHAMPDTLSGGQQQRVAIARALAMKPEVMLFDEPTSALDPRMASEVEAVLADLAADGQTMIVVTHSMRLARRTAQRLHVMESGRIVESGTPDQILDAPRHDATRRFLHEADGR